MSNRIAVIKTGGKQYKVKEGQILKIEKLEQEEGAKIKFTTLLTATTDGAEVNIGRPELGDLVEAKVLGEGKDKKVRVVKYKNKTRYTRNKGHRQNYTKVEIVSI